MMGGVYRPSEDNIAQVFRGVGGGDVDEGDEDDSDTDLVPAMTIRPDAGTVTDQDPGGVDMKTFILVTNDGDHPH